MPYLSTYNAFAKFADDTPTQKWYGLTKGQAQWRYHWIARQYRNCNPEYSRIEEYGWQRDWQES